MIPKLSSHTWNLLLTIGLVAMGYFLIQSHSQNRALKRSIEVLQNDFDRQQEEAKIQLESLQEQIKSQETLNEEIQKEIDELQITRVNINQKHQDEKDSVARISDADSLAAFLTRRYR